MTTGDFVVQELSLPADIANVFHHNGDRANLAALTKGGTYKRLCSGKSMSCLEHPRQQLGHNCCHRCPGDGQRGTYATLMVFTNPFICRATNIVLEYMLVITVTDNVRRPRRKLYSPTGPSYITTEMRVPPPRTNRQSITRHQSSDSCIAPVTRPKTRLPLPFMVNASSLT